MSAHIGPDTSPSSASDSAFRRVLRNASYLTLAQVGTRIAGFAYVLILARLLPEAEFGILTLALSVLLVADMIADLGLSRVLLRDLSRDPDLAETALSALLPLKLALSGAVYLGLVAVAFVLDATPPFVAVMLVAGVSLLPSGLAMLLEGALQASQRFAVVSIARGCLSLGQAGLGIGVLLAGGGAVAVAATFAAAYAGFLAALAWALARTGLRLHGRLDVRFCRDWLLMALPFSVVGIVFALTLRVDLLVLGAVVDPSAVAVYGMAAKVVEAALLATIALSTALAPLFARQFAQARDELIALYLRSARFGFLLTIPAALAAAILGPPILRLILPPAFDAIEPLLRMQFAGFPFWVGYYLNAALLLGTDRQYRTTAVLLALILGQVAVSLLLVPRFGPAGAAAAFALSGFLSWLGTSLYVDSLLGVRAVLARSLAGPFLAGASALAVMMAAGAWSLPAALALFAGMMMAERRVRAILTV